MTCLLQLQLGGIFLVIRPLHAAQGYKIAFVRGLRQLLQGVWRYDFVA